MYNPLYVKMSPAPDSDAHMVSDTHLAFSGVFILHLPRFNDTIPEPSGHQAFVLVQIPFWEGY